jgi:hypothetical protein
LDYIGEYSAEEDGIDRHWWGMNLSQEAGLIPPCQPGDIIYIRETWGIEQGRYIQPSYKYGYGGRFDDEIFYRADDKNLTGMRWKPSIHMPKKYARIFRRVTDVRVQRVQDISHGDALSEGVVVPVDFDQETFEPSPRKLFFEIWDSIYAKRGLGVDVNPWVWAYTWEPCNKPEGWPDA